MAAPFPFFGSEFDLTTFFWDLLLTFFRSLLDLIFINFTIHFLFYCLIFFSCADPSADPVQCQNGTYAPSGSLACLPCPEGAQCLTPGLSEYVPCHDGTYLSTDANNVTSCQSCPPGKRCPNPNQAPEDCPDGTYSKGGTVACTVCPGGHRWVFKFR